MSANIAGMNEISLGVNASASKNKLNSKQTIYENGIFSNVNEVHNNTENMTLSGFNQEGGSVAGNIKNLKIESLQNTSKTDGYTIGGNISVGITNAGAVSGNIHGSKTKGNGEFVDNQTTFIVGENSNLKIGNVDNTASIIGTSNNGKIEIDNYTGRNLENHNKLKTVGGSIGTSGVGLQYSNSEKEGITRNTVVGNVEISNTNNSDINYDISKANEITKDSSFSTNIYAENQLISAIAKPNKFKEKLELAKIELQSTGDTLSKKVDNIIQGNKSQDISTPESRSLNEIKETIIFVQNSDEIKAIASKDITKEEVQKELGLQIQKFNPDDPSLPQNVKNRILELRNKKQEEIYAFYDESTGNIFVNENIPQEELRPSIAREWKIQQDFKNEKGKLNEEGKKRATVAGEIAYQEAKEQMKKNSSPSLSISNLANAEFNFDSEVSADKIGEIYLGIKDTFNRVKPLARLQQQGNDDPTLVYKNPDLYATAGEKFAKEFKNNVELIKYGWNRVEYLQEEIPRLAREISQEKNALKKSALTARYEYLIRDEKNTSLLTEGLKGGAIGATGTAIGNVVTMIPHGGTMLVTVGAAALLSEEKHEKIPLTETELGYIKTYAPEYFYIHQNDIQVIKNTKEKELSPASENKILHQIEQYYKNAKTPDEQFAKTVGVIAGGVATTKSIQKVKETAGVTSTNPSVENTRGSTKYNSELHEKINSKVPDSFVKEVNTSGISSEIKSLDYNLSNGYKVSEIRNMSLKDLKKIGETGNANFLKGNGEDAINMFKARVANIENIKKATAYYKDGTVKGIYYTGYDKFGNKIVYRTYSSTNGSFHTLDLYKKNEKRIIKEIKFKE